MRIGASERVVIYLGLALAIGLGLGGGGAFSTNEARARAADPRTAPTPSIAVCAVYRIADELMETERFKPERVEFETQLREETLRPLYDELRELQSKLEAMDQKDPTFAELRERYFRLQNQARSATQEIAGKVERKVAEQLEACYQLVRSSAVAVAEDLGFNYVLASNGTDEPLKQETVVGMLRDIMSRPAMLAPKEADITEDVRQDLKLE